MARRSTAPSAAACSTGARILRTLAAIRARGGDVILASHDGDFAEGLTGLLDTGRRVGRLGFSEFNNSISDALQDRGLQIFDLETDATSFDILLPRVRVIPLDQFDPVAFL